MKLLDPFAGYRLASGHPFFHIALFTCSWFVDLLGSDTQHSSSSIHFAFSLLRWGHFSLFMLALIEAWANTPSSIPEKSRDEETKEEDEIARLKIMHRDSQFRLFARILATISVFGYQGIVFYTQFVLSHALLVQNAAGEYELMPVEGNKTMWLVIETACFYLYMFAAIFYILGNQILGVFQTACNV